MLKFKCFSILNRVGAIVRYRRRLATSHSVFLLHVVKFLKFSIPLLQCDSVIAKNNKTGVIKAQVPDIIYCVVIVINVAPSDFNILWFRSELYA